MRATRSAAELLVGGNSGLQRSNSAGSLLRPPSSQGKGGGQGGSDLRRLDRTKSAFDARGLCKHEFGHALGDHGLAWNETIVTNVQGQALKKGIKPGWKIYQVDGHVVKNADDIWLRFQDAKWQWRSTQVTFVMDMAAIRKDASMARAAKIQAETERLARLPFDGNHDSRHLDQVAAEFKFQGFIEEPEARAVSTAQLVRMMAWTADHCHRWRDPKSRQKLHIDTMTLNQLNHWLIKPATKQKDCTFAEMMAAPAAGKDVQTWYVVSWWGEQVSNMLKVFEAHSRLRGSGADSSRYWIAAYAMRQHSLPESLDDRRAVSTRVFEHARYHTLLILDSKEDGKSGSGATAFTRSWCNWELLLTLEGPKLELDVAAVQQGKAVLMTQNLTEEEQDMERVNPGSGVKLKEQREKGFSTDLIKAGLTVKVEQGLASEAEDVGKLLNAIAKRDAELEPLEKSDEYIKASRQLRAIFALTAWQRVVSVPGEDQMKDMQLLLAEVLRADAWRESLTLSLAYVNNGMEKLALLERSLAPHLKELRVNLSGMHLGNEHLEGFAKSLPQRALEKLHLNLSGNEDIDNVGIANFMNNVPPKLQAQSMILAKCGVTKEFEDRGGTLEGIKSALYEESQKGSLCTTCSSVPPSGNRGRMTYAVEKSKCF